METLLRLRNISGVELQLKTESGAELAFRVRHQHVSACRYLPSHSSFKRLFRLSEPTLPVVSSMQQPVAPGVHQHSREQPSTCVPGCKRPTFKLGLDQVEHLAEAVLKGKGLDSHGLQLLTLLLVEVLQLIHAQHPVPVQVHAAEPVLHARTPQQT